MYPIALRTRMILDPIPPSSPLPKPMEGPSLAVLIVFVFFDGSTFNEPFVHVGTAPPETTFIIPETGVYNVVILNCGTSPGLGSLTGKVSVFSSYGYLPGNDIFKVPLYGIISVIYSLVLTMWFILCIRHWGQVIHIHHCLSAVVVLGFLESFMWYTFYSHWNSTGTRNMFLMFLSISLTVLKNILSYMLVLVASLGWGLTRPSLDVATSTKIQVIVFFYFILDFIRQSAMQFRISHGLSVTIVITCIVPISLLNSIIFLWIFNSLTTITERLAETNQHEKLRIFTLFWTSLVITLIVGSMVLFVEVLMTSRDITRQWRVQWLFIDCIPHMLYLAVLIAMIWLWCPNSNSKRYAYSREVPTEDEQVTAKELELDQRDRNTDVHVWGDEVTISDPESDD